FQQSTAKVVAKKKEKTTQDRSSLNGIIVALLARKAERDWFEWAATARGLGARSRKCDSPEEPYLRGAVSDGWWSCRIRSGDKQIDGAGGERARHAKDQALHAERTTKAAESQGTEISTALAYSSLVLQELAEFHEDAFVDL
ncbi:MAG: hypothetical protein Q9173_006451, partial [Seirophora scorigena]